MDSKEVYLEIFISYDGKDYQKKSNEFIKFEELKIISIKEFNILEEDSKYIKYNIKESENKIISIENDIDILNNMKKIDDYNYEIKLNITLDKNNLIQEEEIKEEINLPEKNLSLDKNNLIQEEEIKEEIKLPEKNLKKNEGVKNLIILFYKKLLMKERMERRIERVINCLKIAKKFKEFNDNYEKKIKDLENKINDYEKNNFQHIKNKPLNKDINQDVIFNDNEINQKIDKIKKQENIFTDLSNIHFDKIKAIKEEIITTINKNKKILFENLIDNNKNIYKGKLIKILENIKELNNKNKPNKNAKLPGETQTPFNSKNYKA